MNSFENYMEVKDRLSDFSDYHPDKKCLAMLAEIGYNNWRQILQIIDKTNESLTTVVKHIYNGVKRGISASTIVHIDMKILEDSNLGVLDLKKNNFAKIQLWKMQLGHLIFRFRCIHEKTLHR